MLQWQTQSFSELSVPELYQIMQLRQQVFVVEQQCIYQDLDGLDQTALHLCGWQQDETGGRQLSAYLRIFAPTEERLEVVIGRVLTAQNCRGDGLGRLLMEQALTVVGCDYPNTAIYLSAQQHLEAFYASLGFETCSDPYDEDGIPHIAMVRQP
ncbi:MAG: GNAT family N-acetyltransferase [Pseudomonadales bacterium]